MSKRGPWIAVLGMILTGLGAALLPGHDAARAADSAPDSAVPATIATAQMQDVPVFLNGLGTVQPLNTVEVKAQVGGTLLSLPVTEGQEVRQGDVVAVIDPRPFQAALDQATAQRTADMATLKGAQLDLERYQRLAKTEFAPRQQVDDQQATVDKQAAAVAVDTAQVETARINLGYCTIRSPIDGRAGLYQLTVGNLVQAASQTGILSITQMKPIGVVFTLPEADLSQVQDAMAKGAVSVQVAPGDAPDRIIATGTLLTPNNTIDSTTGTISLKARFANKDERLWPGEFANARVQVATIAQAVTVPLSAVQHGPDGLFVYTVKPDQSVAQVAVKLGYQDDRIAVVTDGLAAAQTIVVNGQSRLGPGMKVKPSAGARS